MHAATLVFTSLNAAELREVCQFMRANRKLTLATALLALFAVYVVDGEDTIVPRELPLLCQPFTARIIGMPDDLEELPF